MQINITYKDHPFPQIYGKVSEQEAIRLAQTKEDVRMFVYSHKPTRIAMVTINNGNLVIGQYRA